MNDYERYAHTRPSRRPSVLRRVFGRYRHRLPFDLWLAVVLLLLIAAIFTANAYAQQAPQPGPDVCADQLVIRVIIDRMMTGNGWDGLAGNPSTPPGVVNNPNTGVLVCHVDAGELVDAGTVTLTWQSGQPFVTAVAHFVSDHPKTNQCDFMGARIHHATREEFQNVYHCDKRYYWN